MIPLRLTATSSATDIAIQKKFYESGMNTLITWNEEIKDIIEIVKHFQESGLLNKGVSKTSDNEKKGQKAKFPGMFLDAVGTSLLGNMLAGKGVIKASEGTIRAGQHFYPLTYFET